MEKKLLNEKSLGLLSVSKHRAGIESDAIQRFVEFCELTGEDVLLDTNCGRGEFLVTASRNIEHSLGCISDKAMYDICCSNAKGITNITLVNRKLDNQPFKRSIFSVVVNRFGLTRLGNPVGTLSEIVKLIETDGRLCIQDFCDFEDNVLTDFFNRFDYLMYSKSTPVERFSSDMFASLDMKVVKENIEEEETNFMWYIDQSVKAVNIDRINHLIKEANQHPLISKYIYLKNDVLNIRRRVKSVIAIKK